jgi:signal transduction histidine kinase
MVVAVAVAAAALFQFAAAILALRVLRVTGWWPAWMVIAGVAFLMAIRRTIVLYQTLWGDPAYRPDAIGESVALAISVLMLVGVAHIAPFFVAIRRSEDELRQRTQALVERVKELNCLYGISKLVEQKGDALDEICQGVAGLIVASMQRPELAAARITLREQSFTGGEFVETPWRVQCDIVIRGRSIGQLVVCYREDKSRPDEPLFLPEERNLINATAERLGDIAERIQAQQERAALQEQLHQAQKMEAIGQLSCGVAHDFNNLVTVVLGHVAAARTAGDDSPPVREALNTIEQAAYRARDVTEALLKFSGRLPTEKRPIDLCAAVRESARLLRHTLPASIELVVHTPEQKPVWVRADSTQLQQVILNLALNARDAMPDGGTLRVAVAREGPAGPAVDSINASSPGDVARLEVADTGVGMPPEVVARVFDPFFTTKARGRSTGLGLSIVHAIVEDHGGTVSVESRPGAGSKFTVRLPCTQPKADSEAPSPELIPPPGRGELVLVAEDHQLVREIIVSALQSLGYKVRHVSDGTELLECYRRWREQIRLFILDLDLPKRSGLDCLREIRADGMTTPALLITAKVDADLERQLDADTVLLCKPFGMNTLGALTHSLLDSQAREEASA